jgi:hypothetical protein
MALSPRRLGLPALSVLACLAAVPSWGQSTAGTILGSVADEQQGAVVGASVTVRNVDTNVARTVVTDATGRFRMPNLPPGNYQVSVDLTGFASYIRSGITLAVNQDAVLEVVMKPATLTETVTVQSDAPLLNTTTPEVGVRFDTKRVAELPVSNQRDVFALALSAPGVSQLGSGQAEFASGTNFAVNGGRVRSNNFMVDGQDSNDPSVTGRLQPINMTDVVQEIRLITNQFTAEYGRAAGSVMNVVTKSGTNALHGSGSWFLNRDSWNSRSNLDEAAQTACAASGCPQEAPFRKTDQYGGTLGGPIVKDRTFFFVGYQRWTDRALGSGQTLNGAPTEAGRQVLQQAAGSLPQVQALLKHLPAAQTPLGRSATFTLNGQTYVVPLGSITSSADQERRNDQAMVRLDHHFSPDHTLSARYLYSDQLLTGFNSQVTPAGLLNISPTTQHAGNLWLTSILSNTLVNELRFAVQTLDTATEPEDPTSLEIPSIEISELGLSGFNAGPTRTAIGYGVNLPQSRKNQTYQIQETLSYQSGGHAFKFGFDLRRNNVDSDFNPTIRGRLAYSTLQSYVDDVALAASINKPLPGGQQVVNYKWDDYYFFAQDEWRLHDTLTLTLGARYELPGNAVESLVTLNGDILAVAGNDPRFALSPVPGKDKNNIQPRVGFNWNPHTGQSGLLGFITGGDKLVVRGGFARTNDYQFLNLALNIASSFPFVGAINIAPSRQPDGSNGISSAFGRLPNAAVSGNPMLLTRTVVAEDFRAPILDQFSFELQRQMTDNFVLRAGYVGTRGKDLFQTLEGNPFRPFSTQRVDPTRGLIRLRTNTGESTYHSLQLSGEQRFNKGFSAGFHYTYSSFKDDGSDTFNPSSGEVATPQDPFDIDAGEFAPSTYDRPHRFTANFVWELPVLKEQKGVLGRLFGGWQISSASTWQSGVPFTVFNGADPTGQHAGSLVGNPIRPNLNTDLDLSDMTIQEILEAGGASLFRRLCGNPSATCAGERMGNAPRNLLRSDRLFNVDLAIIKNTKVAQGHTLQFRLEMFNATNTRSFGIPNSAINSANFLNEKGTNGGNRFIWLSARYVF